MSAVEEAARIVAKPARMNMPVVFFTGAGISEESGIPTFRGRAGIWRKHDPEEVATPEGFMSDPTRGWRFHEQLRQICLAGSPNVAHLSLAWIEAALSPDTDTAVITQNIDGLHQAAGSGEVIEIHGSAHRVRCLECDFAGDDLPREFDELPPRCECGELLRPDVVWFGEQLPREAFDEAQEWARKAAVLLMIGTSATVQPAASLPVLALQSGAELIEINPSPTVLSEVAEITLRATAGSVMPELAEAVVQLLNGESIADVEAE